MDINSTTETAWRDATMGAHKGDWEWVAREMYRVCGVIENLLEVRDITSDNAALCADNEALEAANASLDAELAEIKDKIAKAKEALS